MSLKTDNRRRTMAVPEIANEVPKGVTAELAAEANG